MTISIEDARRDVISHDGATATYTFDFSVKEAADVVVYAMPPSGAEVEISDYTVALSSAAPGGSITLTNPANYPNGTAIRIVRETEFIQALRIANTSGWFPESLEAALDEIVRMAQEADAGVGDALKRKLTDPTFYDALASRINNVADPTDGTDAATMRWVQQQLIEVSANPNDIAGLTAFSANLMTQGNAAAWMTALAFSAIGQAIVQAGTQDAALQAAGVSAYMTDPVQAANVTEFFTDMGAADPALWASLIGAVDANTMLGLLNGVVFADLDYTNLFPNGDMQIAQEGEVRVSVADGDYIVDSVIGISETSSLAASTGSGGPAGTRGRLTVTQINADERCGIVMPIETANTTPFVGEPVSVGFDFRAPGTLTDFRAYIMRWNGTADAINRDPVAAWGAADSEPTWAANWFQIAELEFTADGTWQRFVIENEILAATVANFALVIVTSDPSFTAGQSFEITGVKVEQGAVATKFVSERPEVALERCQRQFYSTFLGNTEPAEGLSRTGAIKAARISDSVGVLSAFHELRFPVRMVKAPSIDTYSPEVAGTGWRVLATPGLGPASDPVAFVEVHDPDEASVMLYGEYTASHSTLYFIHVVADARL